MIGYIGSLFMWRKGILALGTVATGAGGFTYYQHVQRKAKINNYLTQFHSTNPTYKTIVHTWRDNKEKSTEYDDRIHINESEQSEVRVQLEPLQRKLIA